jgi:uncharacterized OsmC-like protein
MTSDTAPATGPSAATGPAPTRSTAVVTAQLTNGHARLSAGQFNWESDLPASLGGGGLAPSPTAYLLGALAGCGVAYMRDTLAPEFGVTVGDITATASATSDVRGLLGVDGIAPDLGGIRITIEVVSPDPAAVTEPMLAAWQARCPILLALVKPNDVTVVATAAP